MNDPSAKGRVEVTEEWLAKNRRGDRDPALFLDLYVISLLGNPFPGFFKDTKASTGCFHVKLGVNFEL